MSVGGTFYSESMETVADFDPDEAEAWARPDGWYPPVPSALDLVIEADATISIRAPSGSRGSTRCAGMLSMTRSGMVTTSTT